MKIKTLVLLVTGALVLCSLFLILKKSKVVTTTPINSVISLADGPLQPPAQYKHAPHVIQNAPQHPLSNPEPLSLGLKPDECEEICGMECVSEDGHFVCPAECNSTDDCASEERCFPTILPGRRLGPMRCVGSNCSRDSDTGEDSCGPGQTCRFEGNLEATVFRCEPDGVRDVGEPCVTYNNGVTSVSELCAKGLSCSWNRCLPEHCVDDDDCPKGSTCSLQGLTSQQGCVAICQTDKDCPENYRCADWSFSASIGSAHCVSKNTPSTCLETGCSNPDEDCVMLSPFAWGPKAECRKQCVMGAESDCREGEFCFGWAAIDPWDTSSTATAYCLVNCNLTPCKAGLVCVSMNSEGEAACAVDYEREIANFFGAWRKEKVDEL